MDFHPSIDNKYYLVSSGTLLFMSKILEVRFPAVINDMLGFIFYGLGIVMFAISLYEWNNKRLDYNKLKKNKFKPDIDG